MSRTANDESSAEEKGWSEARNKLFRMIMEGRSFSGRERNCCFLNTGNQRFATISAVSGLDFPDDGRCIAVTDWDGDGDLDLWMSSRTAPRLRFMRNNLKEERGSSNFVAVKLQGNGSTTNRDAIGARVEVVVPNDASENGRLVKSVRAGEGFLSQGSKWIHFGLGAISQVDGISVSWPNGNREVYEVTSLNRRYILRQGEGQPSIEQPRRLLTFAPRPSPQSGSKKETSPATSAARIVLQSRVPMPSIQYAFEGDSKTETFERPTSTLVTLWASWCQPCVEELSDFSQNADLLSDANVKVLALCVDRLGEAKTSDDATRELLQQISFPHPWGYLDANQMNRFQDFHNQLFFLRTPLPLPTSFLVDQDGRLAVIYRGGISARQVVSDAQVIPAETYSASMMQAACLPGTAIQHPLVERVAQTGQRQSRYLLASSLRNSGNIDDAYDHFVELSQRFPDWSPPYRQLARLSLQKGMLENAASYARRAITADSQDARAHNTLALVYSETSRPKQALTHYRLSIQCDPEFAEAHNNLGTLYAEQGDIQSAERYFRRATELDDSFAEAHTNLGNVFAAKRKIPEAIAQFRKAIEVQPTYVDAHNNLGTMYGVQRKYAAAQECYLEAVRLAPNRSDIQRNLARAKSLLGK